MKWFLFIPLLNPLMNIDCCFSSSPFLWSLPKPAIISSEGPSRDGTIGEDTIRASLISAVSDKLRWRMKEEMDKAQAELDALKRTEEDLKKGHQKLEEMVSRLDQEVVRTIHCSCVDPFIDTSSSRVAVFRG